MKTLFFTFITLAILLAFGNLYSQDFTGTYSESQNSYVTIGVGTNGYDLSFSSDGKIYAYGSGNVINGKLYFTFWRTDNASDGGFGIYHKNGENLKAYHYNLDFSKRWTGDYKKH